MELNTVERLPAENKALTLSLRKVIMCDSRPSLAAEHNRQGNHVNNDNDRIQTRQQARFLHYSPLALPPTRQNETGKQQVQVV